MLDDQPLATKIVALRSRASTDQAEVIQQVSSMLSRLNWKNYSKFERQELHELYGELTLGPRGGSGPVTRGRRRMQSGISVSEAPCHVPVGLPVPERQCHVAEQSLRDSLDAQSVATVDDEELEDPPGLDLEDSAADLFPPPTPRRQRKRAPPPRGSFKQ